MHVSAEPTGDSNTPARRPALRVLPAGTPRTNTVVLLLHGGKIASHEPARGHHLAYLRMVPVARGIHRAGAPAGAAVWLLRNRYRGWNEPVLDAVADARWALEEISTRHPRAQIVLVGHSMGGRVALRVADAERVTGVCALAPWIEDDEPIEHLADRSVLIVHGTADRMTSPTASAAFARRACAVTPAVRNEVVAGSGHAMLRRRGRWDQLVQRFVGSLVPDREERR
ncbi:alpha/beta hydrolase [Saccharopolyspora spinosporotrichia]|uniref:Alpha/beta hydrolase n=1 Tax=Saccharopolyspora erythraea TaxID=1836 RepID=A0ABN1CPP8_SACER|nr:alpha/beta fold hydrolase [Saccharopolyspora erythraea]